MQMRNSFPGYQQRGERELERLWAECAFTFDASALLDLYRLTPRDTDVFFDVLERLKDRLWLPHQAGLEYYDNRLEVIGRGVASYDQINQMAREAVGQFRKGLDRYRQYRWIEAERWAGMLDKATEDIGDALATRQSPLKQYADTDPVEQRLHRLFGHRVGPPYKGLHEVYERAEQRIQLSVPPGFKDAAEKKDFHRYGDIVIWFQLLDFAQSQKKAIVFVTGDSKADWWLVRSSKTIGPRPELVQEMLAIAGVPFHMYSPDRFVEYAQKYLKLEAERQKLQKVAKELREVAVERAADSERVSHAQDLFRQIAENWPGHLGYSDATRRLIESMTKPPAYSDEIRKLFESMTKSPAYSDEIRKLIESMANPIGYNDATRKLLESMANPIRDTDAHRKLMEDLSTRSDPSNPTSDTKKGNKAGD